MVYEEYQGNEKVSVIIFDEQLNWDILCTCNDHVVGYKELFEKITSKYSEVNENILKEKIVDLKKECLLYCNEKFDNLISIIDTSNVV
jgi:hypothetical protein